jgi:hypothetical protein
MPGVFRTGGEGAALNTCPMFVPLDVENPVTPNATTAPHPCDRPGIPPER